MRLQVIEDWKRGWKFASVQWNIIGILCMLADVALNYWDKLPPAIAQKIPNAPVIALVLFALAMLGRFLKVKEKTDGNPQEEHW